MRTKKAVGKRKRSTLKRYVCSSSTRTKKAVGKRKRSTLKRYVCSSPTCAKVFEKPKVVRYFACPYCLSKIEKTDQAKNQLVASNESVESQIENKPVTIEERREAEIVRLKTSVFQESPDVPETVELAPSGEIPGKINDIKTKDGQCKYYFGYLQNREKGEGIPETCVECPKSIDCMLSKLYESPTAVSEIKKWYNVLPAS